MTLAWPHSLCWNHTSKHLILTVLTLWHCALPTCIEFCVDGSNLHTMCTFLVYSQIQHIIIYMQFTVTCEITNWGLRNRRTFTGTDLCKCCGFYKSRFICQWRLVLLSWWQEIHSANSAITSESSDSLLGVSYIVTFSEYPTLLCQSCKHSYRHATVWNLLTGSVWCPA